MHVTLAYGDPSKKFFSLPFKTNKDKENIKNKAVTPEKASSSSDSSKDLFCVYCKMKGHSRDNCVRLKRKEQNRPASTSSQFSSVVSI